MVLGVWLVFSFILSAAYKCNLIASLALPKYPSRPESLDQLVQTVNRITMPSYGSDYLTFLRTSDSASFRAWGRQSHVDGRRYLEQMIAEHFTETDGSSRLYVGRDGVLPGLNAWPVPHDAPYKSVFDRVINAVQETGLYKKWMADMLDEARRYGRKKRLEEEEEEEMGSEVVGGGRNDIDGAISISPESLDAGGWTKPLTLVHLQGPLFLLLLGLFISLYLFCIEIISHKFNK
ncbi:hypothetical protein Pmani_028572 [Petrolisthes manimaculis]|uniref:Variant Ionotropic Glutamate Receptor n=1 Tax=Petrolisthes manimaculis TaxID=1843537 RepID=A0AAE1NZ90_9EUCA|nr:hypothetical protein Pmani_028572 [Petrolisthes manimaculis]